MQEGDLIFGDLFPEQASGCFDQDGNHFYLGSDMVLRKNQEELFINGVNSLCLRPHANTEIDNFFVAGDYVRTSTDLATMESANEAARLAVNGVLEHYGASEPPCGVWKLEPVPREAVGALGALLTQVVGQAGKRAFQASAAVARSLSSTILNWRR